VQISSETLESLKYDADGLIPAVIVDAETKAVLMVAYMNKEALPIPCGPERRTSGRAPAGNTG